MSQRNAKHFSETQSISSPPVLHGSFDQCEHARAEPEDIKLNRVKPSSVEPKAGSVAAHVGRIAMLGEISGSIVHELNQPLTAIMSNAQSAQQLVSAATVDREELCAVIADII